MKDFKPMSLCILGRQPELGTAELERLYGSEHLRPLAGGALLDIPAEDINFKRLGGTIKVARVLAVLPNSSWPAIERYLTDKVPEHLQYLPEGKFTLGLSVYNLGVSASQVGKTALTIKKIIRKSGRPVRVVPNNQPQLNSAQVLYNQLTHKGAWELLLVGEKGQTYLAQTLFVQDIDAYAARDQARPKRDARVGMLPPKLAQILINLAVGQIDINDKRLGIKEDSLIANRKSQITVLDPFCGTGVILQEALLMGCGIAGSDLSPRMADYTKENLEWLRDKYQIEDAVSHVQQADATAHKWTEKFDVVASELYLGRPLARIPDQASLRQITEDVNTITKKFLQNIAGQLQPGASICLAVPAWQTGPNKFIHLPLIDHLTDLGYNLWDFKHVDGRQLIYYRPDQIVGRQLLVITKQ